MFFKNLMVFRLPAPWNIALGTLEENLNRGMFAPCHSHQAISRGWTSPRQDGHLVHAVGRQWLIALKTEQRLLPTRVVNQEVKDRAERLADEQGYAPGRKALRELKERVIEELMPRAFTQQRTTFVWIDPNAGILAIDASTNAKAEEVIEQLRHCLDDFPLKPLHTNTSPQSAMADWLAGEGPDGFSIDDACQVKAIGEEKTTVTYQRHPIEGMTEIRDQLAKGLLPTKLAMTWDDRISFVLTEKLEVKRLGFLDLLKEEAEKNAEHADEQFDADFAIMTGELARFLPQLIEALGGEVAE